jgi:hypothetical protein
MVMYPPRNIASKIECSALIESQMMGLGSRYAEFRTNEFLKGFHIRDESRLYPLENKCSHEDSAHRKSARRNRKLD